MGKSRLFPFMEYQSLNTVRILDEDFGGDTLSTFKFNVSNGGGNSAADPVIRTGTLNGECRFVTGDAGTDAASSDLTTGLQMRGDRGAVVVACLTLSSISDVKVEFGFTDALNDAGAVLVKADSTFTATDCALWVLDTTDNGNWEGLGANNGTTAPMATVEAAISPTATTFEWLMVELLETDDTNSECAVVFRRFDAAGLLTFEEIGGGIEETNAGPNSNVLLTPWLYVEALTSSSINMDVDYFGAWQRRTATVT